MVKYILMNKKAQGWGLDLTIASVIFLIGMFFMYTYAINYGGGSESILSSLNSQAKTGSSLILSEGSPENWEGLNNTETPGITTNNRINQTKLNGFYNITDDSQEYQRTKNRLDIKDDFYFNFSDIKVYGNNIEGIGKKPENYDNLVKTERITIYDNKITKFNLYIWN